MQRATKKTTPAPRKKRGAEGRDKEGRKVKGKIQTAQQKKRPKPNKVGRPAAYTEELAAMILEETANTTDSLKRICERKKGLLPAPRVVRRWIAENEEFRHKYMRAKEEQADVMAEELADIADELVSKKKDLTHEEIAAARLRVDVRKWAASKLKPKKYGDRTDITTDGESLNNPFLEFLKLTAMKKEA